MTEDQIQNIGDMTPNQPVQDALNSRRRTMEHSERTRRDLETMLFERQSAKVRIDERATAIIAEARDCDTSIKALEQAIQQLDKILLT